MQIGIPRETKPDERRVALTPSAVRELADAGHELWVERDAGAASGFADAEYAAAGATLTTADSAWAAEFVLKVKEPVEPGYRRFHEGLVRFSYLHLAADPALTEALVAAGVTAIAYHAATVTLGLGARVTVFDTSIARLNALENVLHGRTALVIPSRDRLEDTLGEADGVVHYAVTNMRGGVPRTSTRALVNATLPYACALAADGLSALERDPGLAAGLNVRAGEIVHPAVRAAHAAAGAPA